MFSTAANVLFSKQTEYTKSGYLDLDDINSDKVCLALIASRVMDVIAGLALVMTGALGAAGYIPTLNSVGCYAMLTIGALEISPFVNGLIHIPASNVKEKWLQRKS